MPNLSSLGISYGHPRAGSGSPASLKRCASPIVRLAEGQVLSWVAASWASIAFNGGCVYRCEGEPVKKLSDQYPPGKTQPRYCGEWCERAGLFAEECVSQCQAITGQSPCSW